MAEQFSLICVSKADSNGELTPKFDSPVLLSIDYNPEGFSAKLHPDLERSETICLPSGRPPKTEVLAEFTVHKFSECSRIGPQAYIITVDGESTLFKFKDDDEMTKFHSIVNDVKYGKGTSAFAERTDRSSAEYYFSWYGYFSEQQKMLEDYVRTSTYQRAILSNSEDFSERVVLDVGAGSGILSFFAVQAGAQKVYAVEASSMAQHAEVLVAANNLQDHIKVIAGKMEEIELPELVDVIISEPMGYMLFNERMLETYLHARKWLKPNGLMFPSQGDLYVAPFMDDELFMEQTERANFWVQTCFHGVDLSSLRDAATKEYFRQPVVDSFDMRICLAKSIRHSVNFSTAEESDLHEIEIPLEFHILTAGTVHGLAIWFDVAFIGSTQTLWLSTSPSETLTHWYQTRCLLELPLFVKAGQLLKGTLLLQANKMQSYDVTIDLSIEGIENARSVNIIDLKNPHYRSYYFSKPTVPPGVNTTSPSEAYWSALDVQGASQADNMANDASVNRPEEVTHDST